MNSDSGEIKEKNVTEDKIPLDREDTNRDLVDLNSNVNTNTNENINQNVVEQEQKEHESSKNPTFIQIDQPNLINLDLDDNSNQQKEESKPENNQESSKDQQNVDLLKLDREDKDITKIEVKDSIGEVDQEKQVEQNYSSFLQVNNTLNLEKKQQR